MPKYVKILHYSLIHRGFKYKEGLNQDNYGLHFTDINFVYLWLSHGDLIADVTIPAGTNIITCDNCYRAEQIVINNIRPITDHPCWNDEDFCLQMVKKCGNVLQYITNQTPLLCKAAIFKNPYAYKFCNVDVYDILIETYPFLKTFYKSKSNVYISPAIPDYAKSDRLINRV
jgi:hypothetical protein